MLRDTMNRDYRKRNKSNSPTPRKITRDRPPGSSKPSQKMWTGGPGWLFPFGLTAPIDERIPLLQYTRTLRSEGAPRVAFTRGSLDFTVTIDPVSGQNRGTTRPKDPHVTPTCGPPNSSPHLSPGPPVRPEKRGRGRIEGHKKTPDELASSAIQVAAGQFL